MDLLKFEDKEIEYGMGRILRSLKFNMFMDGLKIIDSKEISDIYQNEYESSFLEQIRGFDSTLADRL